MTWLGWRQQRLELLIAAAVFAAVAAYAVPVGIHMASVYSHDNLSACTSPNSSFACATSIASFSMRFGNLDILFTWATLLPAIGALLLAAPFVLDLDNGTCRLYWTQSISRRRWVVTKLAFGVAGVVVLAAALAILAGWTRGPLDTLNGRMDSTTFDSEGFMPIAFALFVFGLAVAIGALWRRAVPSLLAAFVAYVVARVVADGWLRLHLLSPTKATWAGKLNGPNLQNALVINQFPSDRHGHQLGNIDKVCVQSSAHAVCVEPPIHGYVTAIYIGAGRFWSLQAVEFALIGGIGTLLVVAAGWWTQRRAG